MIRPLGHRVFIRVEEEPPRSSIIQMDGRSRMQRGTIIALGPKASRSGLEVGDVVVFAWANFIHENAKAVDEKVKRNDNFILDGSSKHTYGVLKDTDLLFVLEPGYTPTLS